MGFGDFYPVASFEKLVFVGVLVYGVIMFSLIHGQLRAILMSYGNFNADFS